MTPYADPRRAAEHMARYQAMHPEMHHRAQKRDRDALRFEALVAYSGTPPVCACCGERAVEFLALDHVEGDGSEERRRNGHKGGTAQYRALRRAGWPPGYRVLCHNCNFALGAYGYCPHGTVMETIVRAPRMAQPSLFDKDETR